MTTRHDNVHKISHGNHGIRSEPCWLIKTWGALSYRDQTSPAARLMWLKQLVAQDTERRRFTPPLHYNNWCMGCGDICRCSWSMSRLIIDHNCISSHMKLQVKSVSSWAARTANLQWFLYDFFFMHQNVFITFTTKEHKTNIHYACVFKLYLKCQRDE